MLLLCFVGVARRVPSVVVSVVCCLVGDGCTLVDAAGASCCCFVVLSLSVAVVSLLSVTCCLLLFAICCVLSTRCC